MEASIPTNFEQEREGKKVGDKQKMGKRYFLTSPVSPMYRLLNWLVSHAINRTGCT